MMCNFSSAILFWMMAITMTMMNGVSAFVVPISTITSTATSTATTATNSVTALSMIDVTVASSISDTVGNIAMMSTPSTSLLLAETEAWVKPVSTFLGPFLNFMVRLN